MYIFTITMVVLLALSSIFSIAASMILSNNGKKAEAGRCAFGAIIRLSLLSWGLTAVLNGVP